MTSVTVNACQEKRNKSSYQFGLRPKCDFERPWAKINVKPEDETRTIDQNLRPGNSRLEPVAEVDPENPCEV